VISADSMPSDRGARLPYLSSSMVGVGSSMPGMQRVM
jgi:hypothetical protein